MPAVSAHYTGSVLLMSKPFILYGGLHLQGAFDNDGCYLQCGAH